MQLDMIEPVAVAAYVEKLLRDSLSKSSVKQHLAAIRMMFDWMVAGGVLTVNPAAAVRGPQIRHQEKQDSGPHSRRGPAAAQFDRCGGELWPARPRPGPRHGLYLCPPVGGRRHERRGLLPTG